MSLTDKEIALELTKLAVEHYNVKANLKALHSHLDVNHIQSFYNSFYQTVSKVDKNNQQ
ncbi:hypothetical protein BN1356_00960 [Streptococcus varani]|uniref:Uncharacterized protein n=1 Tax=Streptococcus varani TaxID=1608583 RepID=A0A0E4CSG4_9STRE|nr:hypothetical protein BN1356_00960 [Streptococcus varani]